ncbi:MAG TPA: glycosyltransferase [Gaiellaceae bacterium]|nr:glycosyltransferase [Gaiellaceae bacterium]
MRRTLVLAYYFPPLGGAGVQRTVKLLKYLPAHGYAATVVTAPEHTGVDWAPPDPAQSDELPVDTEVIRTRPPAGGAVAPADRSRADKLLDRPGAFARWWVEAAAEAGIPPARSSDVLYATMSPFESAEAARRIAAATGIPWVADLRDPWALDEWTVYPSALHRIRDERRMARLLSTATTVVMNTEEARREVARRFPALASRLEVVTNGFDADDLALPPEPRTDDRVRIVYAGYSHVEEGLRHRRARRLRELRGAAAPGLDILARSHVFLLEAVRRLAAEAQDVGGRLELHLAGASPTGATDPFVVERGYLPHRDAVALMRSADVLFLPMHDVAAGSRVRTVPGKTYEYLASGRPILAALPDGDARDLLAGLPGVRLCAPTDVEGIAAALRELAAGAPAPTRVPEIAARFERRVLAGRLAEILDCAAAGRSAAAAA